MIRAPLEEPVRTITALPRPLSEHSVCKRKVLQFEKALPPAILPFAHTFVPLHKEFAPFLMAVKRI